MLFDASMMWLWTSWRPGSTDMPFRFTSLNLIFEFFQNFASHFKGINRCWLGQFHTSTSAPSSRWPPRCRPRRRSCRTRPPSPASETWCLKKGFYFHVLYLGKWIKAPVPVWVARVHRVDPPVGVDGRGDGVVAYLQISSWLPDHHSKKHIKNFNRLPNPKKTVTQSVITRISTILRCIPSSSMGRWAVKECEYWLINRI